MAEYHVLTDKEGNIIAACLNKSGKWSNKTVVTTEALAAVRDHLITMAAKENKDVGYAWAYPNGKTLVLQLEEQDTENVEEEKQ